MSTTTSEAYTSEQAMAAAGVSYRRLDYWARTCAVPSLRAAAGSGSQRCWSAQDVAALRVVARLADLGARTQVLGAVYRWLHDLHADAWLPSWSRDDLLIVHRDGGCTLGGPVRGAAWVVDLADTDHHP